MGVGLEFAQGQLGYRTYEVFDMYANTLGVLLGWAAALVLPRIRLRETQSPAHRADRADAARLAAPGMLLALFQTAVSVADTYFIGRLGTESLAGLALVFPMVMLLQMTSAGAMGGGVSSAVARALGAGNPDAARKLVVHALVIAPGRGLVSRCCCSAWGAGSTAARRPRRGARAGARLLAHPVRRRGAGLARQHARQPAARQRQHARAGARAGRRGAGADSAFGALTLGWGRSRVGHRRRGDRLRHRLRPRRAW